MDFKPIRFIATVWNHWEARFGTTFAVLLAVMQAVIVAVADPVKVPEWIKTFPPLLWLSIGAVLLFWSCYAAWRDVDTKLAVLKATNSKPSFSGKIKLLSFASGGPNNESSIVTAVLSLNNPTGPPSITEDWKISVIIGGEEIVSKAILSPKGDIRLGFASDPQKNIILGNDNWLPRAGKITPIPSGGGIDGWLMGLVPCRREILQRAGNMVRIRFNDVTGYEHTIDEPITGITSDPLGMDGLQNKTS